MALDLGTPNILKGALGMKLIGTSGEEAEVDNSGNIKINGDVSATFPSAQSVQFDSAQDVNVTFPGVQTVKWRKRRQDSRHRPRTRDQPQTDPYDRGRHLG